jgi:hypothetical protein
MMTLQEVCEKYKVSESSMKNAFPRTQQSILKKHGVKIIKEGRGEKASYSEELMDDKRALTMYNEQKAEIMTSTESFQFMSWDFLVLLAIITTPMLVFRGSYDDFLKYVDLPTTENNRRMLKDSLIMLQDRDIISYTIDKTNNNYFVAALYRQAEEQMGISISMIRTCKQLADKHHKRSWIPLLKTWIGVEMLSKNQPYTVESLCAMTGLSAYQIRESNKILKESAIYRTSKAYANYNTCIGTKVDLNAEAFYNI